MVFIHNYYPLYTKHLIDIGMAKKGDGFKITQHCVTKPEMKFNVLSKRTVNFQQSYPTMLLAFISTVYKAAHTIRNILIYKKLLTDSMNIQTAIFWDFSCMNWAKPVFMTGTEFKSN